MKNSNIKKQQKNVTFRYEGQPTKFRLGTLLLVGLCTFLIIIATFTQLEFRHFIIPKNFIEYFSSGLTIGEICEYFTKYYKYIPQVPVIVFIAALLGKKFGSLSVLLYIIMGLFFFPVFALGGGIKYVFEYNFGYILAYLPAVFFAGSILSSKFCFKNILKASVVAVLTIHFIGILYTFFIGTILQESNHSMIGWIFAQSGTKIIYDIFFSLLAIVTANWLKKILWLVMC